MRVGTTKNIPGMHKSTLLCTLETKKKECEGETRPTNE